MRNFSRKETKTLFSLWLSFKKMRNREAEAFGDTSPVWISMLEREALIDELFKRLGETC